jgi:hypothetical protein
VSCATYPFPEDRIMTLLKVFYHALTLITLIFLRI